MQKFRDYIYVDDDRIKSYMNQISEFHKIEVSSSYERGAKINGGLDVKIAKLDSNINEKKQ